MHPNIMISLCHNMMRLVPLVSCFVLMWTRVVSFHLILPSSIKHTTIRIQCQQSKDFARLHSKIWLKSNDGGQNSAYFTDRKKRRQIIGTILSVPISLMVQTDLSALAATDSEGTAKTKPFAPLENLLPAIRVKVSIDSAIALTRSLMTVDDKNSPTETKTIPISSAEKRTLEQLENLLLKPQNYVQSTLKLQDVPPKPGDLYLKSYKPMNGDLPFQRLLVQSADVDAWKRLKRTEKNMERSSEVRAALNAYTDAVSFSADSYLLTVDKDTRSSMIRQGGLPDIKQVINSDMGMRYLYRNQVLTAMDDVKAELEFQITQIEKEGFFYGNDLLDLLESAREAMDRWLSLVPTDDVLNAMKYIATQDN